MPDRAWLRPLVGPLVLFAALLALPASATSIAGDPAAERGRAWWPDVAAAKHYARRRSGDVRFAIERFDRRTFKHNAGRAAPMRSLLKPMLMVAYLRKSSVRGRGLHRSERRLLGPMIKSSDNAAASEINRRLSPRELKRLARKARMKRFSYEAQIWGNSRSTAGDQARFMRRLNRLLPERHRAYARGLLKRIVPSQRWGVADARPRGWELMFKSGWGSGTGEADHQVAILERGFCRITLAIFTVDNPSHPYARKTERGVAKRLFRGLGRRTCRSR